MQRLIIRPLLTEKTLTIAGDGWYTFVVKKQSRKAQIAREISRLYDVKVIAVRTATYQGKVARKSRKMVQVLKPDWKKALVRLAKGQTIEAFSVQSQGETKK